MAIVDIRVQIGTTPIWGTPFTEGHLVRMMERHGIEKCLVSSTIANSCDFERGNAQIKTVAGKGGLLGCAVASTQYPPQSIEDLRKYLSSDSFVATLIRSGIPGRPVPLDEATDIANALRRYTKPVMIEASSREGVLAADEIARAFPGLKFVLLGMGGPEWRTAVDMADKTLNLYLEVSGMQSMDKIRLAAEAVGAHRMLFGSDMPFSDPSVTIGMVEDAKISDTDKRLIFGGTAKRLFGWSRNTE